MTVKEKLETKLNVLETELHELTSNQTMRDMCFTSAGCNNKSIQHRLTAYRNKIGVYGEQIDAIKLALKIVNHDEFTHDDILNTYTRFLQVRNPEIYYDICSECCSFKNMMNMLVLVIDLFLPICKSQVKKMMLYYRNDSGSVLQTPLVVIDSYYQIIA